MDSALAWVGQIAAWIGQWIPRWIVLDSTMGAVKFEWFFLPASCRRFKGSLRTTIWGPGIWWYWPATTLIGTYPTAFQTDNLPSQTMETADGVAITVGGMVTYTVEDVGKLLTQTHSGVKMIQALALAAVHDVCCNLSWPDLREAQRRGTLDTKLRNAVQRQLTDFGVRVVKCMLTDMAKARVYRLIQSTQQDDQ